MPHKKRRRDEVTPSISRDTSLPIFTHKAELKENIRRYQTTIVCGETGCGKSTQLPQFLVGLFSSGCVVCTQPRRVAAVTIAERVALERGCVLGEEVGYSIRFDDKTSHKTRIKYVTDGVLLREIMTDTTLSKYSCVILDEAHERSLQTDILIGLLRRLQENRPELRIVVMSATLEVKLFMEYFKQSTMVKISGRQFPVQILYTTQPEQDIIEAALLTCLQIHEEEEGSGGVLVFLPGQEDIESLHLLLEQHLQLLQTDTASTGRILPQYALHPLYAALSSDEQMRAFQPAPAGTRKFVLATNIAETSVTISGIRYVVDPGKMKSRCMHPYTGADMLQVMPVSQSQANQRAGRAGRECEGKCFRLFTEEAFDSLQESAVPEIQRVGVAQVILQLFAIGVENPLAFPYPSPPSKQALHKALTQLLHLGALTREKTLSDHGRTMAKIPLEPSYAHLLLCARDFGCMSEALTAVAMLSTDNVYVQPHREDQKKTAGQIHRHFASRDGDFVTLINIYEAWSKSGKSRGWSARSFINHRAMTHAASVRGQISQLLQSMGIDPTPSCLPERDPLLKCIAKGLSTNIACAVSAIDSQANTGKGLRGKSFNAKGQQMTSHAPYRTVSGGQDVYVHPSSALFARGSKLPRHVVFAEILVTTKHYMRCISVMDIGWLQELNLQFIRQQEPSQNSTQQRK